MISRLTFNLMTDDMEASVNFYTQLLGFQAGMTVPETKPWQWVQLNAGEIELMLQTRVSMAGEDKSWADAPIGGSFGMYTEVDTLEEMRTKLSAAGITVSEITETFYGMKECRLLDPNGYHITLAQRA
jgi:catechol 2,3-dioxygenase-like lactoylglutathione lyase family enzyme